eukprot:9381441-Alexandrium_andersonii.AAC.1
MVSRSPQDFDELASCLDDVRSIRKAPALLGLQDHPFLASLYMANGRPDNKVQTSRWFSLLMQ